MSLDPMFRLRRERGLRAIEHAGFQDDLRTGAKDTISNVLTAVFGFPNTVDWDEVDAFLAAARLSYAGDAEDYDCEGAAFVIAVRHPDHPIEFTAIGDVEIIDLDLGSSFDITRPPNEDDLDAAGELVASARARAAHSDPMVRERLEEALAGIFGEDAWSSVLVRKDWP